KAYTDGKAETNFALEPGQSVTLKHRVLILSGPETPAQLAAQYKRYTDEVKYVLAPPSLLGVPAEMACRAPAWKDADSSLSEWTQTTPGSEGAGGVAPPSSGP